MINLKKKYSQTPPTQFRPNHTHWPTHWPTHSQGSMSLKRFFFLLMESCPESDGYREFSLYFCDWDFKLCTHTHTHTHARTHTHTYIYTHTHTDRQTHTHTYIHMYTHRYRLHIHTSHSIAHTRPKDPLK